MEPKISVVPDLLPTSKLGEIRWKTVLLCFLNNSTRNTSKHFG